MTGFAPPTPVPDGVPPLIGAWSLRHGLPLPPPAPDPQELADSLFADPPALTAPGPICAVAGDAIRPCPWAAPPLAPLMPDAALPDPRDGCIMAVIDDAIPFAHQQLRLPGGLSRLAALWVQDAAWSGPPDLPCGAQVDGVAASAWLARLEAGALACESQIYRQAGLVRMDRPNSQGAGLAGGHGAAVTLLAAGMDPGDPDARRHPLIGVALAAAVIADSAGTFAEAAITAALGFVVTRARMLNRRIAAAHGLPPGSVRLPLVINLSLGLTAGPRDGSTRIERLMDAICDREAPDLGPVHVVLPTGNHRAARMRASLAPGGQLGWQMPPCDTTPTVIEAWGPPASRPPCLVLTPPGGPDCPTRFDRPGQSCLLIDDHGRRLAQAVWQRHDGGDCVTLIAAPTQPGPEGGDWAPPGRWRIALDGPPGPCWALSVQRDEVLRGYPREARQSWLDDGCYRDQDDRGWPILRDPPGGPTRVQRGDTVNAYATGRRVLRAGAVARRGGGPMPYASLIGADLGGDVLVPVDRSSCHPGMIVRGRTSGGFAIMSGSSMAAPWASRWLAGQLARGARPADRQAVAALAGPGPCPVLPAPPQRG